MDRFIESDCIRTVVLGIPVDNVSMDEAIERIFGFIGAYRTDGRARLVTTINVDFTVKALGWFGAARHPELLQVLREADLSTADGMPIVWYSRVLGCCLPDRVTGADLVPTLSAAAAVRGASIYLLGGEEGVGRRAVELLSQRHPGLRIVGLDSSFVTVSNENPGMSNVADTMICERINLAAPDILFIAFGNPKQELWFNRNRHRLRVPVSIGIGGSFNFLTGTVPRAPAWMQRLGVEWVHRLVSEPRRLFPRYMLGLAKFSWMSFPALASGLWDRVRMMGVKSGRRSGWSMKRDHSGDACVCVFAGGRFLDMALVEQVGKERRRLAETGGGVVVLDLGQVRGVVGTGLGALMQCLKWNRDEGAPSVLLSNVSRSLRRRLRWHRMADLVQRHEIETAGGHPE